MISTDVRESRTILRVLALAGGVWMALGSSAFADVQISLHDGRVSISARDATVRQILTEWARVGRTRIVNAERISAAAMTIELKDVPEKDALDMLLRSISGYLAAPRVPFMADASLFDRIIVMPAGAQPRAAPALAPAPFALLTGAPQPLGQGDEKRKMVASQAWPGAPIGGSTPGVNAQTPSPQASQRVPK